MKKLLVMVLVLLLMVGIFLPIAAEAACKSSNTLRVVSVSVYTGFSDSIIYFRPSLTSSYVYQCVTNDDRLIDAALKAMTNQITVQVQGDGSCPTTGAIRNIGRCDWITLLP